MARVGLRPVPRDRRLPPPRPTRTTRPDLENPSFSRRRWRARDKTAGAPAEPGRAAHCGDPGRKYPSAASRIGPELLHAGARRRRGARAPVDLVQLAALRPLPARGGGAGAPESEFFSRWHTTSHPLTPASPLDRPEPPRRRESSPSAEQVPQLKALEVAAGPLGEAVEHPSI